MRGVGPFSPTAKDTILHLHQIIHLASFRHWRIEALGLIGGHDGLLGSAAGSLSGDM